jgi:hypothetical protein
VRQLRDEKKNEEYNIRHIKRVKKIHIYLHIHRQQQRQRQQQQNKNEEKRAKKEASPPPYDCRRAYIVFHRREANAMHRASATS